MLHIKKLVTLVLLVFSSFSFSQQEVLSQYRLGAGDRIQITVFGQSDLSITTRLADSEVISYPFLGDLDVIGLTAAEVESKITNGLKGDYLINPSVSVSILDYRPFFIDGEVKRPGGYAYQPGLSIDKAAALAGGYTERASKTKIFIRRDVAGKYKQFDVNRTDIVLPGDIVTVQQSFF